MQRGLALARRAAQQHRRLAVRPPAPPLPFTSSQRRRLASAEGLSARLHEVGGYFDEASRKPSRVLLSFSDRTSQLWDPQQQRIQDMFAHLDPSPSDFGMYWKLKHGDKFLRIPLSGPSHVDTLSSCCDEGSFPEIEVDLKHPTTAEQASANFEGVRSKVSAWIDWAKKSIVGEKPCETQVVKAEEDLMEHHLILDPPEYAALEHEGYSVDEWSEAVPVLAKRLQLTDVEEQELLLAAKRRSGHGYFQSPIQEPGRLGLRITSYRTAAVDGEIHLVYGHLRLTGSAKVQQQIKHTVSCAGRTFTVLPEASPYSNQRGLDMIGATVTLPPGGAVVHVEDPCFAQICNEVVKPHGWHCDVLVCRNGSEGEWVCYETARYLTPGRCWGDTSSVKALDDGSLPTRFKISGYSFRLLVEVPSGPAQHLDTKLTLQLTRFGELFARSHWAKQLGLAAVVPVQQGLGGGGAADAGADAAAGRK